jgi:4-amino-4-deoxy-L-arabinose transferase-like glycosyltransferase
MYEYNQMHQKENKQLILIGIVILGFMLRFSHFSTRVGWNNDVGRDYLAGYLLSYTPQYTLQGHWNSGIDFAYPSYYYYIVAALTSLIDNSFFVTGVFTTLHALSIFVMYHLARVRFSNKTSLAVAFFYAVHPYIIRVSLFPLSAHFSLPLFLCSLYCLYRYIVSRSPFWLATSCAILAFISTFFYGALLLVPFYIVCTKFRVKELAVASGTLFFSLSLLYAPFLMRGYFFSLLAATAEQKNGVFTSFSFDRIRLAFNEETMHYFGEHSHAGVALFCFMLIFLFIHKKVPRDLLLFVSLFTMHMLLLSVKGLVLPHYLILVTPFFFLGVGSVLEKCLELNHHSIRVFIGVCMLILLVTESLQLTKTFEATHEANEYQQNKILASILKMRYPNDTFAISEVSSPPEWDSRSLWYFLRHSHTFIIDDSASQIAQKGVATVQICKKTIDEVSEFCDAFLNKENLHYMETIVLYPSEYQVFQLD